MVTTRSSRTTTGADGPSAGAKHTADGSPDPAPAQKKTKTTGKKATESTTPAETNRDSSEQSTASRKATVEDVTDSEDARSGKRKTKEDSPSRKRQKTASPEKDSKPAAAAANGQDESAKERAEAAEASPILEKGLVYFFLRGKVDVESPENLNEVKRSYMVLRPIPLVKGIPDEEGKPVKDEGKARLIAIPKKRLPSRGYEKFLTFVEEPGAPVNEIGEKWLKGRTYMTKTVGERTDHAARPIGEGVYAITKAEDERQSHFAYMLTVPESLGEIQDEFGLKEKGSFVVSVRNPKNPAPANAAVPDPAEYSQEIMEEFGQLKWGALQPKHLDYKNCEILFIGEKHFPEQDAHEGTGQELLQLEDEDEERVKHLGGTNAVFADLEKSGKELGEFAVSWGE